MFMKKVSYELTIYSSQFLLEMFCWLYTSRDSLI